MNNTTQNAPGADQTTPPTIGKSSLTPIYVKDFETYQKAIKSLIYYKEQQAVVRHQLELTGPMLHAADRDLNDIDRAHPGIVTEAAWLRVDKSYAAFIGQVRTYWRDEARLTVVKRKMREERARLTILRVLARMEACGVIDETTEDLLHEVKAAVCK
ncbi:MAG: hypothetical protein M1828_006581 [Chrysothrix sp. TS-e1954]|nr:MAG: hypothetical protein M1828_006581 [Chrysothrix sp. TS-e1954]